MLGSVRELAGALLAFTETRTRLVATEFEEQAISFIEIVLWIALALFFTGFALIFLSILIMLVFWDHRLLATAFLAVLFLCAGAASALAARARLRERPAFFAATLDELRKDRERLGPKP